MCGSKYWEEDDDDDEDEDDEKDGERKIKRVK